MSEVTKLAPTVHHTGHRWTLEKFTALSIEARSDKKKTL
jgi:hypothetical protein